MKECSTIATIETSITTVPKKFDMCVHDDNHDLRV